MPVSNPLGEIERYVIPIEIQNPETEAEYDSRRTPLSVFVLNGSEEIEMTADNGDRIVLKVTSFKGADGQTYYSLDPVKNA